MSKKFKPADRRYNGVIRPYRRLSYNGHPKCLEPEQFPGIAPGQYITDAGEVIKMNKTGPTIVRQDTSDSEYWVANISFIDDEGERYDRIMKVHRLMGMVFMPIEGRVTEADYKDLEINHLDGDKANDSLNNLEWSTRSGNMRHAYDTGLNGNDRLKHRKENIDKTKKHKKGKEAK